jgi:hypothetical protein
MKQLNLSLTNELYGKLIGASAVLQQGIKHTVREFLTDGADVVLNGNFIEIEDLETFERLRQEAKKMRRQPASCQQI